MVQVYSYKYILKTKIDGRHSSCSNSNVAVKMQQTLISPIFHTHDKRTEIH